MTPEEMKIEGDPLAQKIERVAALKMKAAEGEGLTPEEQKELNELEGDTRAGVEKELEEQQKEK